MPFEPGREKTGGRKKGTPNKVGAKQKEWIASVLENYGDFVNHDDFKTLSPRDRVMAYISLLEFVTPKMQRTELTDGDGNQFTLIVKNVTGNAGGT